MLDAPNITSHGVLLEHAPIKTPDFKIVAMPGRISQERNGLDNALFIKNLREIIPEATPALAGSLLSLQAPNVTSVNQLLLQSKRRKLVEKPIEPDAGVTRQVLALLVALPATTHVKADSSTTLSAPPTRNIMAATPVIIGTSHATKQDGELAIRMIREQLSRFSKTAPIHFVIENALVFGMPIEFEEFVGRFSAAKGISIQMGNGICRSFVFAGERNPASDWVTEQYRAGLRAVGARENCSISEKIRMATRLDSDRRGEYPEFDTALFRGLRVIELEGWSIKEFLEKAPLDSWVSEQRASYAHSQAGVAVAQRKYGTALKCWEEAMTQRFTSNRHRERAFADQIQKIRNEKASPQILALLGASHVHRVNTILGMSSDVEVKVQTNENSVWSQQADVNPIVEPSASMLRPSIGVVIKDFTVATLRMYKDACASQLRVDTSGITALAAYLFDLPPDSYERFAGAFSDDESHPFTSPFLPVIRSMYESLEGSAQEKFYDILKAARLIR